MNKAKRIWQSAKGEIALWWMWLTNLFFVFFSTKSQVRVFKGYMHFWFAKKYADKRYDISKLNKYAGGKRHYVIPVGDYSLAVLNRLELNWLKDTHKISKNININTLLKQSYYITL